MAAASQGSVVDHKRLYEDLHEVAPQWQTFGVHLTVPFDRLQGFQGEASMVERCFMEVIIAWLHGEEGSCTVEQLVYALKMPGVDQGRLAREIEQSKTEVKLELPFLMEKLKGCKASWFHLGVGLGVNEAELKKFQNEKKNNGILQCFSDTLTFWLNSGEADLNTLVKAVELSGHKRLAADIKLKYQGMTFAPVSTDAATGQ